MVCVLVVVVVLKHNVVKSINFSAFVVKTHERTKETHEQLSLMNTIYIFVCFFEAICGYRFKNNKLVHNLHVMTVLESIFFVCEI